MQEIDHVLFLGFRSNDVYPLFLNLAADFFSGPIFCGHSRTEIWMIFAFSPFGCHYIHIIEARRHLAKSYREYVNKGHIGGGSEVSKNLASLF